MVRGIIIGFGYWGKIIYKYIVQNEYFDLVEICKSPQDTEVKVSKLLRKNRIEFAFVCTPVESHYTIVKKLIESGINVFCEKPLCKAYFETIDLYNRAKEKKVKLFVDYIYAYSPSVCKIKQYIEEKNSCIKYIDMNISQFGKFYSDVNVYEVLSVHMFSVLVYLLDCDINIIRRIDILRSCNGICQSGIVEFSGDKLDGRIYASLVDTDKQRKIKIICEDEECVFDMLSEDTLVTTSYLQCANSFSEVKTDSVKINESNNLYTVVDCFAKVISGDNELATKNKNIAIRVARIMDEVININKRG